MRSLRGKPAYAEIPKSKHRILIEQKEFPLEIRAPASAKVQCMEVCQLWEYNFLGTDLSISLLNAFWTNSFVNEGIFRP